MSSRKKNLLVHALAFEYIFSSCMYQGLALVLLAEGDHIPHQGHPHAIEVQEFLSSKVRIGVVRGLKHHVKYNANAEECPQGERVQLGRCQAQKVQDITKGAAKIESQPMLTS